LNTIHTIGHSNLGIDLFWAILVKANIDMLVDIRSVPYSRFYPQFNRGNIEKTAQNENIQYVFEGTNLGGRITDDECFNDGRIPTRKNNIAELVNYEVLKNKTWFQSGINKVIQLASANNVVIMCSEEDPSRCHRNLLIGRRLAELGFVINHIRSKKSEDGNAINLFP
jgi:uncharacterized protein (DUF488 family)